MQRPPMHPTELTCPCCLPALGEFSEMPPHGGLAGSLGQSPDRGHRGTSASSPSPPVPASALPSRSLPTTSPSGAPEPGRSSPACTPSPPPTTPAPRPLSGQSPSTDVAERPRCRRKRARHIRSESLDISDQALGSFPRGEAPFARQLAGDELGHESWVLQPPRLQAACDGASDLCHD